MQAEFSQTVPICARPFDACGASRHTCKSGRGRCTSRQVLLAAATPLRRRPSTDCEAISCGNKSADVALAKTAKPNCEELQGPASSEIEKRPVANEASSKSACGSSIAAIDAHPVLVGMRLVLAEMMERSEDDENLAVRVDGGIMCFHMKVVPKISISAYIARIHAHIPLSESSFIVALVYINRLAKRDSGVVVATLTWVKLVLTAILLASKYLDDEEDIHYNNAFYAKVGGLSVKELDKLEVRFMQLLDWRLFVTEAEYMHYHKLVCESSICRV